MAGLSEPTNIIKVDYIKQISDIMDNLRSIQLSTRQFINNPENVNNISDLTEKNRQLYNNILTIWKILKKHKK